MLDSTDNFVEYGTPLEPLEEDEVPSKKPVSVQDQIAVDDQGRRRFHGAFTGGFSAGYYNTVGSKEGWAPSEYKSSRQSRNEAHASRKGQNVQDYMDEEDLGAFGIAPQILRATNDFEQRDTRKRTRPGAEASSSGPIPGVPVLEQIIQPVKDTVGIRILQRMGWKPGQGVGPRQSKAERKLEREKRKQKKLAKLQGAVADRKNEDEPMIVEAPTSDTKVYGCFLPPELRKPDAEAETDSDESIIELDSVTFAPDDFEDPLCNPKENTFGLGYTGLDRNALSFGPVDLFGGQTGIQSHFENRKIKITGEAFGIGAFEDADEEVYSRSDMSQYDFSLETPEERRSRSRKERHAKTQKANEKNSDTGVIPGFVRAKNPPPQRKFFPPPALPKDFEPKHYIRKSRFDKPPPGWPPLDAAEKKKLGLDRHALTITERQTLLGEERIPLTKEEQEELEAKEKAEAEQAKRDAAKEKAERLKKFTDVLQAFSANKPAASQTDSSGRPAFKPFMKNPEKQERYEKYMTLIAAGFQECLKDLQPLEMTEWERERERMEFERASALYKPMGGVMSSRFVSAKSHDISHLVPTREVVQEKDATQDPKVAAKMGLFGKLTHKSYEWHPDRLLCKRFNVPHPHPDSKMIGIRRDFPPPAPSASQPEATQASIQPAPPLPAAKKKSLFDNIDFSKPPPSLLPVESKSEEGICPPGTEDEQASASDQSVPLVADSENIPEVVKPPIDLFKDIFENSSSESEEEEPPPPPLPKIVTPARKSNNDRNDAKRGETEGERTRKEEKSKSKGIFDNLDFARLDCQPNSSLTEVKGMEKTGRAEEYTKTNPIPPQDDEEENNAYGPLPPRGATTSISNPRNSTMSKDKIAKASSLLSKGNRENPINPRPLPHSASSSKTGEDDDDVEWVEKTNLLKGSEERKKSSSRTDSISSSKDPKTNKTHKHKRKKLKERIHTSSSSKSSKKSKKRKESKHKKKKSKNKKHEKRRADESSISGSSASSDDDSSSSSDEDATIQIHHSFNNKALLSKLKEMTRSK